MKGGRVYAKLDVGVLFQDDPKASLKATGTFENTTTNQQVNVSNNASFQQEVANEEKDLQKEIDDTEGANMYPVIALSVGYRF